jgi:pimeloyl-ACP methyl ester carboxylesterase
VNSETCFLEVDGRRLEAAWHGPTPEPGVPALVFLHEGLGCVAMWRDFPQRLAEATGLPALVYSRFGYGASDTVELPRPLTYMHEEGGEILPRVLQAAGITDPILVGHSDGASISVIYAGGSPLPGLRGLILEAPHVFCEDVSVTSIAEAARVYKETNLRERLARYHGCNVDAAFWGWNKAWLDPEFLHWNLEEFLPRIAVPTLVIQGEDDEYGTAAQVEAITRQTPSAEALMLPKCGHSPHRDQPERTLAAMVAFVAGLT